jgi:hypothetical protein
MCCRPPTPAEVDRPFIDVIQLKIRDAQVTKSVRRPLMNASQSGPIGMTPTTYGCVSYMS